MNILQVLPALVSGGVETGTVDLAGALVKAGHKAVVVSNGGGLVPQLTRRRAVHYRLPVHAKSLLLMLWCVPRLVRIIRTEKIDIVHARSRVPAWISYVAARITGVPLVTTCHGYYRPHVFSRVMGWGKRVIVISQVIGRHMTEDFGVAPEKLRCIYRGVDLRRFSSRDCFVRNYGASPRIGLIGRITPLKGHRPFLYAMEKIRAAFPNAKAIIIGDAEAHHTAYFAGLKKLTQSLSLSSAVEFLGIRRDVPQILRSLDVLVLPTTTPEAFGRVLIEAGAVGVPVVATRVGGIGEVIDHEKTGLLCEPNNPERLAEAIIRILRHPRQAASYAEALQKKVRADFSLAGMAARTFAVYEESRDIQRVVVIKLGALGDVILVIPSLRALRRHFPRARIDVVVQQRYAPVLRGCSYIDGVIPISERSAKELRRVSGFLRTQDIDILIDFQNNRFSHLLGFFSGARLRYGYCRRGWGFLLNRGISDTIKRIDPVGHQFRVLAQLSIPTGDASLELPVNTQVREDIVRLLEQTWIFPGQRFVVINAFASPRWLTKAWIPQRYAKLADLISEKLHCRVAFTGTQDAAASVTEIIRHTGCKPANLCGRTSLDQLVELVRQAAVLVTVDSAAMHIAAGVGTPFVALCGPTDPLRHVPAGSTHEVCFKKLACGPCYRSRCFHHRCMRELSVPAVFEALMKVLPR